MLKIQKLTLLLILLSGNSNISIARTSNWQLTFLTKDTVCDVALVELRNDSLAILHNGTIQWIWVDSLTKLRHVGQSTFESGARIGSIGGAIIGFFVGAIIANKSDPSAISRFYGATYGTVAMATLGGLIGGAMGEIERNDRTYQLSNMNCSEKSKHIQMILNSQ